MKRRLKNILLAGLKPFHLRGGYFHYFRNYHNILLVYSMAKVGSSTVYETLKKNLSDTAVFHIHFLSSYWLNEVLPKQHSAFHVNIEQGKKVREYLEKHPEQRVKLVTLVREPVEREISDLFENPVPSFGTDDLSLVDTARLISYVSENDFAYALNWFDTEFKNFTGFDIYSLPFDKEKGYAVYKTDGFDILCIKLESLSVCFREAFWKFTGLSLEQLKTVNKTKEKRPGIKYRDVKNRLRLSAGKLDMLYSSKYVRHFYSPAEISGFKDKWRGD